MRRDVADPLDREVLLEEMELAERASVVPQVALEPGEYLVAKALVAKKARMAKMVAKVPRDVQDREVPLVVMESAEKAFVVPPDARGREALVVPRVVKVPRDHLVAKDPRALEEKPEPLVVQENVER